MSKTPIKTKYKKNKNSNGGSKTIRQAMLSTYDFTSFEIELQITKDILTKHCKKWVFQLEECPKTKKQHFQGRFSLKVKERLNTVVKKFPKWHLSTTSNENIKNDFYVTKEDSRIDGPWKDDDEEIYVPRQVRDMVELYPYQKKIVESRNIYDPRIIDCIVDPKGDKGKSCISQYCAVYKLGIMIPPCQDYRDVMRIVLDKLLIYPTIDKLYLIDIPRALKGKNLCNFFAGIEILKNGYAYDDRYTFRDKHIDRPRIWVFTNSVPQINDLSEDKWRWWTVVDKDLQEIKDIRTFQLN